MDSGQSPLPNGFAVPVHRALTEHILLGGAPRGLAIANATLAGAIGLGLQLWIAGAAFFALAAIAAALGGGGEEGIAFSALFPAAATPAAPSGVAGVSGVLGERCNFDVSCIKRW